MGNIHKQSLAEVCNRPVVVAMRQEHVDGKPADIALCVGCNQPQVALPQVLGTAALNGAAAQRALVTLERVKRLFSVKSAY